MPGTKACHISYSRKGFSPRGFSAGMVCRDHDLGRTWHLTEDTGQGKLEKLDVRKGLELWSVDCTFSRPMEFRLNEDNASVCFCFSLSGSCRFRLDREERDIFLDEGDQGMFFFPSQTGISRFPPGKRLTHITVQATPDRLFSYLEDGRLVVPQELKQAVVSGQNACLIRAMTPAMAAAIHQIRHCPFGGNSAMLFLESRILELIARQIQLLAPDRPEQAPAAISPEDRMGVERARAMLMADICNPPGLAELAKEAGLSHPKLNQCFRKVYGMTLFEYLKEVRLNRARAILEDHQKSVTETAYTVGYASISHFSRAFRDRFGIRPSARSQT
ncbi:MAG: AraC family transcriptional regulator [Desulfobacterales bacterium]|nr:AraC family transcriptional regulator [Desulfobacterales bacterium]